MEEEPPAPIELVCSDDGSQCSFHVVDPVRHQPIDVVEAAPPKPPIAVAAPTRPLHPEGFESWWPSVADTLIRSLYHKDAAVRRNAVVAVLPITERYPSVDVMHLTVSTPDIKQLHELYASKIVIEQKMLETQVDAWIKRIDQLCVACRQEEERVRAAKTALVSKAGELIRRFGEDASRAIVEQQLLRSVTQLEREKDLRVQVARSHAQVQSNALCPVDSRAVDAEIQKAEAQLSENYPPEMIQSIRETYRAHMRNVDHLVSSRVQERCKELWIGGLAP